MRFHQILIHDEWHLVDIIYLNVPQSIAEIALMESPHHDDRGNRSPVRSERPRTPGYKATWHIRHEITNAVNNILTAPAENNCTDTEMYFDEIWFTSYSPAVVKMTASSAANAKNSIAITLPF